MIPIASEVFWGPMAYAIIGGLLNAFGAELRLDGREQAEGMV